MEYDACTKKNGKYFELAWEGVQIWLRKASCRTRYSIIFHLSKEIYVYSCVCQWFSVVISNGGVEWKLRERGRGTYRLYISAAFEILQQADFMLVIGKSNNDKMLAMQCC